MSDTASCSRDENAAAGTCTRCGDFLCLGCIHFVSNSPLRYCAECLDRRAEHLRGKKLGFQQRNKPARVSAVFAVLSMCAYVIPWGLAGIPFGIWGIAESRKLGGEGLIRSILALLLNCFMTAVFVLTFRDVWMMWGV